MADKYPMQADGSGTRPVNEPDDSPAPGKTDKSESAGGAYPNPHTAGERQSNGPGHFFGHGGQSGMAYHGTGQLGDQKTGENPNSPDREE